MKIRLRPCVIKLYNLRAELGFAGVVPGRISGRVLDEKYGENVHCCKSHLKYISYVPMERYVTTFFENSK
jgi:hypothetical protein